MRRLDTLPGPAEARRFAEAVGERGIGTVLRPAADGAVELWVVDEDRLDAARDELAAFRADPHAERFRPRPEADRPEADRPDADRRERDGSPASGPPASATPGGRAAGSLRAWRRCPVTIGLIVASVAATFAAHYGPQADAVRNALTIAPVVVLGDRIGWNGLEAIAHGQLWRVVTPIFPHAPPLDLGGGSPGLLHLLGNMAALWVFGSAVEITLGRLRAALVVLVIAAVSNLAEYWLNLGWTFDPGEGFRGDEPFFGPNPLFYGMSGVVFGLFGLIWMRARLRPGSGFRMPGDLVVMMLVWACACTAGFVGPRRERRAPGGPARRHGSRRRPVAAEAEAAGLAAGCLGSGRKPRRRVPGVGPQAASLSERGRPARPQTSLLLRSPPDARSPGGDAVASFPRPGPSPASTPATPARAIPAFRVRPPRRVRSPGTSGGVRRVRAVPRPSVAPLRRAALTMRRLLAAMLVALSTPLPPVRRGGRLDRALRPRPPTARRPCRSSSPAPTTTTSITACTTSRRNSGSRPTARSPPGSRGSGTRRG